MAVSEMGAIIHAIDAQGLDPDTKINPRNITDDMKAVWNDIVKAEVRDAYTRVIAKTLLQQAQLGEVESAVNTLNHAMK